MNRLKSFLIWLLRSGHSRGFGIQSPTDYAFARYVINEHYPYYGYQDMMIQYPSLSTDRRKLTELYFRLSNWLQADFAIVSTGDKDVCLGYVASGCGKMKEWKGKSLEGIDQYSVLAVLGKDADPGLLEMLIGKATERTLVVMEDIYGSNKKSWKTLLDNDNVRVSFDLYYAGIATFDKTRYKTNYKINF